MVTPFTEKGEVDYEQAKKLALPDGSGSIPFTSDLAHQEVIFGIAGQTLRIRHDQISREAFMPSVILAVKEVVKRKRLAVGLFTLIGLKETQ